MSRDCDLSIRCPDCGTLGEYRGPFREEVVILCADCHRDLTKEFRKAYFAGISTDIHSRLVERDNAPFLMYLARGWREEDAD